MRFFEGQCMIATPSMTDERFQGSVVFICVHSSEGAMGLTINKPLNDISFTNILSQLDITPKEGIKIPRVFSGGPVDVIRGFVLHSHDYKNETTIQMGDEVAMTVTTEVLKDISQGNGPEKFLITLGYVGWEAGQLEEEIKNNSWLPVQLEPDLIFSSYYEKKWSLALEALGITPAYLSIDQGQA